MGRSALQYEIPPDVLHYEPRYWFGLSANDLLFAAFPAMVVAYVVHPLVGVLLGGATALSLRRLDALGGRSLPVYLWQRMRHLRRPRPVEMPLVLPPERLTVRIEDWQGRLVALVQSEEPPA